MKTTLFGILALAIGMLSFHTNVYSAEDITRGTTSQIVEKEGKKYKVVLEQKGKQMRVIAQKPQKPFPSQMFVRVKSGNDILDRITVKLIDVKNKEGALYQGNFNFNQQSTIGIQFEIEF